LLVSDQQEHKGWNFAGAGAGFLLRANPFGLGILTTANLIYMGVDIYNQRKNSND